ncbi:hypothetical protein GCU60_11325 [Blastococcus saxobsidens]|uniref:Uncharacterized protein n=1 Tax=Blastococcus saxobsidens TaxID=138336 RepID=A0A6L9W4L3_9ACTN|nr:hypothetical protein [Blastococcus saxobsidens]NEK86344.1 hypothetical protein [Blastococcus saxobsidens]
MNRGRAGRSLGDRAASSGVPAGPPVPAPPILGPDLPSDRRAAAAARSADSGPEEGRHCWVRDLPESPGTWPGLLVEWRRRGQGWQGRVVYTVPRPDGPALVEAWLPASRLEPR